MFKALFISVWFLMHPVHVTLTSIDFVPDTGTYNVFVRMYFDDFLTDSKLNGNVVDDAEFYAGTSASRDAMDDVSEPKNSLLKLMKSLFQENCVK